MLKQLQQPGVPTMNASHRAFVEVGGVALNANNALLLGLGLIIIPTISGVAQIA